MVSSASVQGKGLGSRAYRDYRVYRNYRVYRDFRLYRVYVFGVIRFREFRGYRVLWQCHGPV